MLGERAMRYYRRGESCSACIFKACEDVYHIKLPNAAYKMCRGINNGFGTGAMCSAAVTSVMFIAYYFAQNEEKIRSARIYFLTTAHKLLDSTDCAALQHNCAEAIRICGDVLEETLIKFEQ